ncbi:hydroxyethylthiazole kinase-like protein [Oryza sativa Japonica Group]|uniref:hydroxyethylthiazole kinase n=1 Tax=Oryza sativa subsp. japonica TaxID=39947 RepID=Q5ZDB4_ORYSJ|nr:hydroxyethylthiazole kinase-like protein [Oryza sativa Japonica Group]
MDEERTAAWWGRRAWELLSAVRARAPLVHCVTNLVSMDIAANALLAAGASPAMVHSLREVPEFTPRCDAVCVNVGTLSEGWLPSMRAAASAGRPWVLDPVAAAASEFRMEACLSLLALRPAVVRGNASEILALASRSLAASRPCCLWPGRGDRDGVWRQGTRLSQDASHRCSLLPRRADGDLSSQDLPAFVIMFAPWPAEFQAKFRVWNNGEGLT